jgi:hypothetical protein
MPSRINGFAESTVVTAFLKDEFSQEVWVFLKMHYFDEKIPP